MASYSAVIDVRVQGQDALRALTDGVGRLNDLISKIKRVPTLFDNVGTEEVKKLKGELSQLVKEYADGNTKAAKFSTSIAGVAQQLSTFNSIAANARTQTDVFTNALKAAARASTTLLEKELDRFSALQAIYQRQPTKKLSIQDQGPSMLVRDLIALKDTVPNSVSALERYQRELLDVQSVVSKTSLEYRELEQAIRQVDVALGRGGQFGPAAPPVQGPRLPGNLGGGMNLPPGMQRMGKAPAAPAAGGIKGMLQKPGVADALIGGSFPLLFGGGAGATIGGAAGGFIGGAMGGPLGMALSLGLSAVGQQLDAAIAKVGEMQKAINSLNVDALRESFVVVNAELDGTIRRLIEAGKYDEARAAAAEAVALQTGAIGTSIQDSVAATNGLGNSWNELVGTISTSVTLVGAPFAAALAVIIEGVNLVAQGFNLVVSTVGQGLKGAVESVVRLLPGGQQILNTIGKAVKGISEENEKIKAQAEAEIEAYDRKLGLAIKLDQIDQQRTTNVSLRGKLINIEADRQEKVARIQSEADAKRRDASTKYAGVSNEILQTILMQITAEEKSQIILANRTAQRQRELEITQEILARDQQRIALFQLEAQAVAAREQAAQQITQAQLQQLELQRNAAGSLQQELGIINQIAAAKTTSAQQAYAAAVREQTVAVNTAALELEKVQNQNARIGGMQREVELATAQYNTALQVRDAVVAGAAATERAAIATADMERRMATLAAYTQQYARQTASAQRSLDIQLNIVNNIEKVTTALAAAYTQVNNATISILQTELQTAKSTEERRVILSKIKDLEISNAGYALQASIAQITAEVQRMRIAEQSAEQEYQRYLSVVKMAEAQGIVNAAHYDALEAAATSLEIAQSNVAAAVSIAGAQLDAAHATYQAAVNAANMKYETEAAALAAGKYADALNGVSGSGTNNSSSGDSVSGTVVQFASDTTPSKVEFLSPVATTMQAAADAQAAMEETLAKLFPPPASSESTYAQSDMGDTSINITTGPVMEFDGTKYITVADLEAAMATTVNTVVSSLRTPSARMALGIS